MPLQTVTGLADKLFDALTVVLNILLEGTGEVALVIFFLVIELLLPLCPGLEMPVSRTPGSVLCVL